MRCGSGLLLGGKQGSIVWKFAASSTSVNSEWKWLVETTEARLLADVPQTRIWTVLVHETIVPMSTSLENEFCLILICSKKIFSGEGRA